MRTFTEVLRANQHANYSARSALTHDMSSVFHSRRAVGNQPGWRMAGTNGKGVTTKTAHTGQQFTVVPVHGPVAAGLRALGPPNAGSADRPAQRVGDTDTRVPWSWTGAGIGAIGGAILGGLVGALVGGPVGALLGAGIGAVGGGVAGGVIGGAKAGVIPTAISRTRVIRDTPGLGPTYYGSVFGHTLSTTGGTITPDVTIAELVRVTRDDFATGFAGVPLGTLTWGPGGTAQLSGNDMFDNIGTNNINASNFLPSPPKPGLPAIMETPQELHYRIGSGNWNKFADVPMRVTLRAKATGGHEVETRVNGVPSVQNYTGPT